MPPPGHPLTKRRWGPIVWTTLHTVAAGYPKRASESHRRSLFEFLNALPALLPCPLCGEHLRKLLDGEDGPPALRGAGDARLLGRDSAFEYTVALHNRVNERLGKRAWGLRNARAVYITSRARSTAATTAPAASPVSIAAVVVSIVAVAAAAIAIAAATREGRDGRYRCGPVISDGSLALLLYG